MVPLRKQVCIINKRETVFQQKNTHFIQLVLGKFEGLIIDIRGKLFTCGNRSGPLLI
jgi:hypothetical protein